VLGILTAHEFGHYFAAKYHRVPATLPYFMPFPLSPLGTLGAVIRMSPYIPTRRALFDIAAAGPIAGLVVALPVSFVGIYLSQQVRLTGQESMILGDTLLFRAMEWVVFGARGENVDLMLHPAAFAGWVGLFVTALNLLPISQLDGGHINYALFGRKSRLVAIFAFVALLAMTVIQGFHYSVILVLLWFMGLTHPPTLNDAVGLDRRRRMLGILLAVVFVLCFTPAPFQL
jgi:membrane-associated protease RseP (regulator of RpoE activity)